MRKFCLPSWALCGLLCAALPTYAQLRNGDFETRNAVPSQRSNAGPTDQPYYNADDLPNWDSVREVAAGGVTAGSSGYYYIPTYASTDGTGDGAFSYWTGSTVQPHSGRSVLVLTQHDVENDFRGSQFITQQLAQPLLAGHRYAVSFWTNRPGPTPPFRTGLSLFITDSSPSIDSNNVFAPSPGNKVLVSGDIQPGQGWVQVSGDITIPYQESANQWLTIGFNRAGQKYDSSLPDSRNGIAFLLDDVSIQDMGCVVPDPQVHTPEWTCTDGPGPVSVEILNYNTSFTYTVTTTGGISKTGGIASYEDGNYVKHWFFRLRRARAGASGTVTVTASAPGCGTGSITFGVTTPTVEECAAPPTSYSAYPNPAAESLTVPEGSESSVLLDSQSRAVARPDAAGKVNVQQLRNGLYNLQIRRQGKLINQRIEVKH